MPDKKNMEEILMSPTIIDRRNHKWISSLKDTEKEGGIFTVSDATELKILKGAEK